MIKMLVGFGHSIYEDIGVHRYGELRPSDVAGEVTDG
jgi:hypothetical protein